MKKSIIELTPDQFRFKKPNEKNFRQLYAEQRKKLVLEAYMAADGCNNAAARLLGISRTQMQRYRKTFDIL